MLKAPVNMITSFFSGLIDFLYKLRRFLFEIGFFKSSQFLTPVISVGNLEMGGTGKTPFVIWLINFLEDKGLCGSVLTRGYKRKKKHRSIILDPLDLSGANTIESGDEPLLIANSIKRSKIIVGANRVESYYSNSVIKKDDFIVLDDGFQHLKIQRDLDIVLVNSKTKWQDFCCIPKGGLREGISAINKADIVLFTKVDERACENELKLKEMISSEVSKDIIFGRIRFFSSFLVDLHSGEKVEISFLQNRKVSTFCGIGRPDIFEKELELKGAVIESSHRFSNHHNFNRGDYRTLNNLGKDTPLICTEKDAVKINPAILKKTVYVLVNGVEFLEGESRIRNKIISTINND